MLKFLVQATMREEDNMPPNKGVKDNNFLKKWSETLKVEIPFQKCSILGLQGDSHFSCLS